MNSLRARVLLLVAGFGLLTAMALALVVHQSVRDYYNNVLFLRSGEFLERVLETDSRLWRAYESDKPGFSEKLQNYVLYSPNTGLYLLDTDGKVLATAGDGRAFWNTYRVDLTPIQSAWEIDQQMPVWGDDPDAPGKRWITAARPVIENDMLHGWLYLVARSADLGMPEPNLLKSYAIRTAAKVALLVLAIGVLLTMAMVAILTRPLVGLTRAAEQVKGSGFTDDPNEHPFPHIDRHDEVGRLSRTFRDMVLRLRQEMRRVTETDTHRREMVASVSHDLRTPLTALIGLLETVRLKRGSLSTEQQQQYVERALMNAHHLQRLTDALAELAKLDNPDFSAQREPIAIGELAADVVQRYEQQAQQAGVQLSIDYPDALPLARVDAGLVERALANLLDNALRVTPRGGEVRVRVRREDHTVRLEVSDTGPGVAPEDQPLIFDRFYQTSQHRDQRGSAGLGLAIVKRVAELHGGSAGVSSTPPRGSLFYLLLPSSIARIEPI